MRLRNSQREDDEYMDDGKDGRFRYIIKRGNGPLKFSITIVW